MAHRKAPSVCPLCGTALTPSALNCPACGSDYDTGWSDDASATAELPEYGLPDEDEIFENELRQGTFGKPENPVWGWKQWVVAVLAGLLSLLLVGVF